LDTDPASLLISGKVTVELVRVVGEAAPISGREGSTGYADG